jgi:hypothetical protein
MVNLARRSLRSGTMATAELTQTLPALVAVFALTAAAVIVSLRAGLKSLERLRE